MSKSKKQLALALQGGGSHGAITWGVLDRLLEEPDLAFNGFSGASAGAMNAAVLAYGLHQGGRETARERLTEFWREVAESASLSPIQPSAFDLLFGRGNLDYSPSYWMSQAITGVWSPYQLNPLHINPLEYILEKVIDDFTALQKDERFQIFVCATNVRRGCARIFHRTELTAKAVTASACLPSVYPAIKIDGEEYWDGGFIGNPPLEPLIRAGCKDILIVQITPVSIRETPKTTAGIKDRINELSFNASLMHELRGILFVDRLLEAGVNLPEKYRQIHLHNINPEDDIQYLGQSSMANARWSFLRSLFRLGRRHGEEWLAQHARHIGKQSTFQGPGLYCRAGR